MSFRNAYVAYLQDKSEENYDQHKDSIVQITFEEYIMHLLDLISACAKDKKAIRQELDALQKQIQDLSKPT